MRASYSLDVDWSLVEGSYKYFPSGYVLLDCNLTGLVSYSVRLGTLVRVTFCQVMCYHVNKNLNVT